MVQTSKDGFTHFVKNVTNVTVNKGQSLSY